MKNKLISSISIGKQLKIKLLDKNDRFNYVNYFGFRDTYDLFLNTPLNISMFVPAVEIGDKWEVLDMPSKEGKIQDSNDNSKENKAINKRYKDALKQYQTAKDNVIFEGFDIKWCKSQLDGEEFFGVTLNGQWCGSYENFINSYLKGESTINGLNNLKDKLNPTLTAYGMEQSGLNK